jgi:hypothetical protein
MQYLAELDEAEENFIIAIEKNLTVDNDSISQKSEDSFKSCIDFGEKEMSQTGVDESDRLSQNFPLSRQPFSVDPTLINDCEKSMNIEFDPLHLKRTIDSWVS